ncbi:MAG: hypothetical protein Q9222_001695 [Ikaeria aurantiellina]
MQHPAVSYSSSGREDPQFRVELPERHSTFLSPQKSPTSPPQRSPVSPPFNRISSPGLESLADHEKRSQTANSEPAEKEYYTRYHTDPEVHVQSTRKPLQQKKWLFGLVAALTCLAIGLGVGLGVGLTRNGGSNGEADGPSPPGANPSGSDSVGAPSTLSRTGAFNGSGIALASQSFASGGYGSIVMYFQHHTGEIRSIQLGSDGAWNGGDAREIVAVDAKNGTPIAAVAYSRNNTAWWHIFYISTNNLITEIVNSNKTNVWSPGPLNDLNLRAMDDQKVGLQACWYGSFYSDTAYNHSPVPGQSNTTASKSDQTVGIHLWYGKDPTTFQSVGWTYGDSAWQMQQTFDGYNAHAGVGCYSWGPGSDTYVFFMTPSDELSILWKDLNTTLKGTTQHPINEWTKTKVTIPVHPDSSVGFTNFLYVQNSDSSISGFNITWAAENTSINENENFTISGDKGLPGTHLSVTALPDTSGGNSLLAFYQTNGTDITEFVRDLDAGQWTSSRVPIPDQ